MKRILRRVLLTLAATAVILSLQVWFLGTSLANRLDFALLDFWFALRGPVAARDDVVIVRIDEASYQNLRIPLNQVWPRELHARLLEKLARANVRKVVFDVLFVDPGSDPVVDTRIAEAFSRVPSVIGADGGVQDMEYGGGTEFVLPYSLFRRRAEPAIVSIPEELGYVRRFPPPALGNEALSLRSLAFAAADRSHGENTPRPQDVINFYGPAGHLKSYSYYQILEDAPAPFPLELLKDKVVFVGLELRSELGPDQKDTFLTSFNDNGRHFGLEIHATAASNLLSGDWIRRMPPSREALWLTVFLGIVCIACMTLPPGRSAYVTLIASALWLLASFIGFKSNFFLPGLSVLVTFTPAVYVGSTLLFYFVARQAQRKLRKAFELYLSPHMASEVTRDPTALGLGGQKVFATAVFTDIAGFTTISESMPAEEVTQMLNDYFSELVDAIFESQGTLIKFIGDAVFALWGAPVKLERHAEAALEAALSIRRKLEASEVLKKYPPLVTRIGIHSGYMVVGNLGSRKRFDFTAIGDSVNLASRVEGLNKYLGTMILMTESAVENVSPTYRPLFMGKARVVGKAEAVGLFTVVDEVSDDVRTEWLGALEHFARREWDDSEGILERCAEQCPALSTAVEFYREQLEGYRSVPPPEEWSGELVLNHK